MRGTRSVSQKQRAAEAARRSYRNNRSKVARQRILNAVARNRCVQERTLRDVENFYKWSEEEKRMLEKCLQNRRERYLIAPNQIRKVRDHRYMTPYPPAEGREENAIEEPPSPISLEGRRVVAITKYNKDGTVDKRSGVQHGRVTLNRDPNAKYKYKIVYDNPKEEPEEWDGVEDHEIQLEEVDDTIRYSLSDAKTWFASRTNADASRIGYLGNVKRLASWFDEKDLFNIVSMDSEGLQASLERNKRWSTDTITKYLQTLLILCGDPKLRRHLDESTPKELERVYRIWKNKSDAELAKRPKHTDVEIYHTLVPSYRKHPKGSLESALGALLSIGIVDRKGVLQMIPRIDNVYREMRVARSSEEVGPNGNWYVFKTGRLVVRKYKTDKKKIVYDFVLPKEAAQAVDRYIQKDKPTNYLFENSVGNPLQPNDLSNYSAEIFGFDLKTQKYRSLIYNYFERVEKADPEVLARAMGHGVTTGQTKYADREGR